MFRSDPALVEALRPFADETRLAAVLSARRPDLTDVLLDAAVAHDELPRPVLAAVVRAGCARLGKQHGGRAIELRVPPLAAVQLSFGTGPKHTRGTPPNLVELDPATFVALITGKLHYEDAPVQASGAHADEIAQAFPLVKV